MAFLFSGPESGHTERRAAKMRLSRPFSFIRTLTVGFGIAPNLLTLPRHRRRRSRAWARHPYRRWGLSPRPENIGRPVGQPERNYAQAQPAQQVRFCRKSCMSAMTGKLDFGARLAAVVPEITILAKALWMIPVCS